MRTLRPSSTDQNPSPNKSRRRFRGQRTEHSVLISGSESSIPLLNTNLSQQMPTQIPQSFQATVSPQPIMELDQLNQRQLLLHALVASSTNGNNHQKMHPRQTPSPAPSLSSTTSSSHASSLDTFRENVARSYST